MNILNFLDSALPSSPFYVLFGRPVGHSKSPLIHNFALQFHHLPGTYHAIEVPKGEEAAMSEVLRHPNFCGANVTIPFKHEIRAFLDAESEVCSAVGAVNTVVVSRGKLSGFNTDVDGFLRPLRDHAAALQSQKAVVFGTGGASRAVVYGLIKAGMYAVTLISRNPGEAAKQKWYKKEKLRFISYDELEPAITESQLLVNTTPLGMHPKTEDSPVPDALSHVLAQKICYDIVYNPLETNFLKQAKDREAVPISGLEMFVGQASVSFKLWTGYHFPDDAVRKLLLSKMI